MRFPVLCAVAFLGSFGVARWASSRVWVRAEVRSVGNATSQPHANDPTLVADPAIAASGSTRERLVQALAGDDPLVSAGKVAAWLESASAETFRDLATAPEKFPSPYFPGFNNEFRNAYSAAIAERWLAVDPAGALPAMQRVEDALETKGHGLELVVAVARLRPELVLKMLPLAGTAGFLEPYATVALSTLAGRDRKAARTLVEALPEGPLRQSAHHWIACGIAEGDPLAAVALASATKDQNIYHAALAAAERIGPGMVRQVLQTAGDNLSPSSISPDFILRNPELAAEIPDAPAPERTSSYLSERTLAAGDRVTSEERERLLASYDSLPAPARDSVAAALCSAWARTEPQKAVEWAVAHGRVDDGVNSANLAAQHVFLRWVNTDPDGALSWWRAQPDSALRDALGTNASTYLAENGRLDAALEIFHLRTAKADADEVALRARGTVIMGGSDEEQATAQLAQILVERDPNSASAWYATLPEHVATEQAARTIVIQWYGRDSEAVARWIGTLPPGETRDQAAKVFAEQAAQLSPEGAAEWVETISDPRLRQNAAGYVFREMSQDDPAAAQQWIRGLRGVDAEWQGRLLRRAR